MDQSSNQDINKDHPVLISPLSCPNFLYLPFIKDGGVFFSDSIGNILISSTSEDIPQVHPNLPDNLLQGTLVLQDELFYSIMGIRCIERSLKWVVSIHKYNNIYPYGCKYHSFGGGFLPFLPFEAVQAYIFCFFFPLKLSKPTYFTFVYPRTSQVTYKPMLFSTKTSNTTSKLSSSHPPFEDFLTQIP